MAKTNPPYFSMQSFGFSSKLSWSKVASVAAGSGGHSPRSTANFRSDLNMGSVWNCATVVNLRELDFPAAGAIASPRCRVVVSEWGGPQTFLSFGVIPRVGRFAGRRRWARRQRGLRSAAREASAVVGLPDCPPVTFDAAPIASATVVIAHVRCMVHASAAGKG